MSAVTIVVPCFNESARLPSAAFLDFMRAHDVGFLFVDDGSTDATAEVLGELASASEGRATVLVLETNVGKGEAVRRGLRLALEAGATIVGYLDADLATPLAELPALVARFDGEPDLCALTAARVRLQGSNIDRRPVRHYAGRVFATAASIVLGHPYYDTQCGAKLFRRCPRLETALAEPFASRWIFDVELLGRLLSPPSELPGPSQVVEAPIHAWRDVGGSKVRPGTFVRAPVELARIAFALDRFRRRPRG